MVSKHSRYGWRIWNSNWFLVYHTSELYETWHKENFIKFQWSESVLVWVRNHRFRLILRVLHNWTKLNLVNRVYKEYYMSNLDCSEVSNSCRFCVTSSNLRFLTQIWTSSGLPSDSLNYAILKLAVLCLFILHLYTLSSHLNYVFASI